ncbi:PAAR domain-containing protein [candidate division KSB1 bacterium]|nr:PAAR domain-containing protein [candidate division KSB1 bacterium]
MVRWVLLVAFAVATFTQAGPAARLGDITSHGGVITGPGCSTVLIGGMPAALMGDMHVCPLRIFGYVFHPPTPIVMGSPTVLIGGLPAARAGDLVGCGASIVMGYPTVLIEGGSSGGSSNAKDDSKQTATVPQSNKSVYLKQPQEISPPTVLESFPADKAVIPNQEMPGLSRVGVGEKIITSEGIEIQSMGSFVRIKAGASKIIITPSGDITIESDQVDIKSTGDLNLSGVNVNISAQNNVQIEGTNITSKASATITSEGSAGNTLKSSASCTILGSLVQIN